MPTFLFAYRAAKHYQGTPATAEEWRAWFESLGSDVEEIGNPVFDRGSVGDTGPETVLGGYSLITADSLAAATELAKGCPAVGHGGGVEVGETALNAKQRAEEAAAAR
jgi:hypothetical protein